MAKIDFTKQIAWRRKKDGKWLRVWIKIKHLDDLQEHAFVDDICLASTGVVFSRLLLSVIGRDSIEPVNVEVTRIVEIVKKDEKNEG